MDFEQIVKRLEWLDDEHRKDKEVVSILEGRIASLENSIHTLNEKLKDANKKVTEIGPVNQRISQYDERLTKERAAMHEAIEEIEKKYQAREKDMMKRYQEGLEEISKTLPGLDQSKEITELRKLIKQRADEDIKLNVAITEIKPKIDVAIRKAARWRGTRRV